MNKNTLIKFALSVSVSLSLLISMNCRAFAEVNFAMQIEHQTENNISDTKSSKLIEMSGMDKNRKFTVKGVSDARFAIFSEQGGKDDLMWFTGVKAKDGSYYTEIDITKFKHSGIFIVEVYSGETLIESDTFWIDYFKETVIAHAMSGIDKQPYTNSMEAFESGYAAGFRTFEVDFQFTKDGEIVLCHGWDNNIFPEFENGYVPTLEEVKKAKVYGKYTPVTLYDLIDIVVSHPDIWIVTDSKDTESDIVEAQFKSIVDTVKKMDADEILDRFVVQLYNEDMYAAVEKAYSFKNYIFTLYKRWDEKDMDDFREICKWSDKNRINGITMRYYLVTDEVKEIAAEYGLDLYGHTINDEMIGYDLLSHSVGIYTDFITPQKANLIYPTVASFVLEEELTVRSSSCGVYNGLRAAVWSEKDGQDDLGWYDLVKKPDGSYCANVDISSYKGKGECYVHVYGDDSNGSHFLYGTAVKI